MQAPEIVLVRELQTCWRYVLINTYGEPPSIGWRLVRTKITELPQNCFMNYDGISAVAPGSTGMSLLPCAQACREPAANIRER